MPGVVCLEEVASFPLEGSRITAIAALPRGRFVTVWGHAVRVWTAGGVLVATLEGHTNVVRALACSASGDIVSGSNDNTVKMWHDNACVRTFQHGGRVFSVAVSPLDGTIVSGGDDGKAKVWSTPAEECVATLEGHAGSVNAVCVLDNGDVATGSEDKTVRVWARGSWACAAVLEASKPVRCMVVVSGGGLAVGTGYWSGVVSLWREGRREWALRWATGVRQLAVLEDIIVACTWHSVLIIQDGVCVKSRDANRSCVAALSTGSLAVATVESTSCELYRFFKPSRLATIRVMITAWSLHGGLPPPAPDVRDAAAALARTLSLRRLCRPRGGCLEVVEPFGRDVVGYM